LPAPRLRVALIQAQELPTTARLLCRAAAVSHRAHPERQAARLMRAELLPEVCSTAQAK